VSGGSYEYLYTKDAADLVVSWAITDHGDMARMIARLHELDGEDCAAELTEAVLILRAAVRRADTILKRCRDVMQAVEWLDSCDWGPEDVAKALRKYRGLEDQP